MFRALLLTLALTLACHPLPPAEPSAEPEADRALSPVASSFDTRPQGKATRGDHEASYDLERVALSVGGARTPGLTGDGRLADMALVLARRLTPGSSELDLTTLAPLARERGLVNPLPQVLWASAPTLEQLRAYVSERGKLAAVQYESTHFGLAARRRGALWLMVLVLDRRPLELDPIPRALASAGDVRVRARLLEGLSEATLIVTRPDGRVETAARAPGAELDHTLALSEGSWGLELMGTGAHGPSVVANLVVQVGAQAERALDTRSDVAPSTVAGFVRELERLIAEERAQHALPALTRDPALDGVALAHSTDMRDHRFFGHVSPGTGGPGDRIARAQVAAWSVRENVARGYTPREVHSSLMASPAHRAALLSDDSDRLGLGVVDLYEGGRSAFYVTELFARAPFPIAPEQALADALARVNAARTERDLEPLSADVRMSKAAEAGARRFLEQHSAAQEVLLAAAIKDARAPRGARQLVGRMFVGMLPASLELSDELLDPAARWLGVGLAQGAHPLFGPATLALVVLVAK